MQSSINILLLLAFIAANLPFLSERIGGLVAVSKKHFLWRVAEWGVLYFLLGLLAHVLEARQMPVQAQGWTFYVVTLAMFMVLAFPGFVYRFFWRGARR